MRSVRTWRLLTALAAAAVVLAPDAPLPAPSSAMARAHAGTVRHVAAPTPAPIPPPTPAPSRLAAALPRRSPFVLLQMNLCNSGFAGCYAGGQSVPEAAAVIRARRPDVVTLNEICAGDVHGALAEAMRQAWPADRVFAQFQPAWDRERQAPYRCRDGQEYGIGVVGRVAPASWAGVQTRGGIYPSQNPRPSEQRAWVCAYAVGNYVACTTHLESEDGPVALAQCQYLMNTAIPAVRAALGAGLPTVVGGDFNLRYGGSPDVPGCVPAGWFRKGDGGVQQVLATSDFTFRSTGRIGMTYTDHDAWLVTLRTP